MEVDHRLANKITKQVHAQSQREPDSHRHKTKKYNQKHRRFLLKRRKEYLEKDMEEASDGVHILLIFCLKEEQEVEERQRSLGLFTYR